MAERMTHAAWVELMTAAGWQPRQDIFGSIVEWTLRRGKRLMVISRADAEMWFNIGQTPPPF